MAESRSTLAHMTTADEILAALGNARRISYVSLLDRLRGHDTPPLGVNYPLRDLERAGTIRLMDRKGKPWPLGYTDEKTRGPLYIERVA